LLHDFKAIGSASILIPFHIFIATSARLQPRVIVILAKLASFRQNQLYCNYKLYNCFMLFFAVGPISAAPLARIALAPSSLSRPTGKLIV
jgi:hypothetical protein